MCHALIGENLGRGINWLVSRPEEELGLRTGPPKKGTGLNPAEPDLKGIGGRRGRKEIGQGLDLGARPHEGASLGLGPSWALLRTLTWSPAR